MSNKALIVIDIQNDITKHYKEIIDGINAAVDWAVGRGMQIAYILHNNITDGTRTFKPGSKGAELVPELKVASTNIFVKTKANALTSDAFASWIESNGIDEFYITGADATACVKSTCFNMAKSGYIVNVISDCITSYDPKKLDDMLSYYLSKGCKVSTLDEYKMDEVNKRLPSPLTGEDNTGQLKSNFPHLERWKENIQIRKISDPQQCHEAFELAVRVFMEFEAPDYPTEGVNEFKHSLADSEYIRNLSTYAAFDDSGNIAGMLATRNSGRHIALFFVDSAYQRLGIGRRLFELAKNDCPDEVMTVNAAPYAIPIYQKLGFNVKDVEQIVNGIRFTPMTAQI